MFPDLNISSKSCGSNGFFNQNASPIDFATLLGSQIAEISTTFSRAGLTSRKNSSSDSTHRDVQYDVIVQVPPQRRNRSVPALYPAYAISVKGEKLRQQPAAISVVFNHQDVAAHLLHGRRCQIRSHCIVRHNFDHQSAGGWRKCHAHTCRNFLNPCLRTAGITTYEKIRLSRISYYRSLCARNSAFLDFLPKVRPWVFTATNDFSSSIVC